MFTKLLCLFGFVSLIAAKVSPKVKCTPDMMRIEVPLSPSMGEVYLQGLKDYPDPACRPRRDPEGSLAILELSLGDVYQCATTRVTNKLTNKQVYYQTLIIEGDDAKEETVHIKCSVSAPRNHTIARRNVLPAGFQEAEDIDLTWSVTGRAPEPVLGVGVRQDGKLVTGELNVAPGTQLEMEISLDKVSSPVYGLLVTHMLVTDTMKQEETIIYNGCSVDPYLFGNFKTIEGDLLRAKFRAFKFPESTYVQFKGTVNVCLGKCNGIECSDGQIGFGRRRRSISAIPADPNKVFEITITSFIKVNYKDGEENFVEVIRNQTKVFGDNKLIVGNQKSERNVYVGGEEDRPTLRVKKVTEETQEQIVMTDSGSPLTQIPFLLIICTTVTRLLLL